MFLKIKQKLVPVWLPCPANILKSWCKRFKEGRGSFKDDQRFGQSYHAITLKMTVGLRETTGHFFTKRL